MVDLSGSVQPSDHPLSLRLLFTVMTVLLPHKLALGQMITNYDHFLSTYCKPGSLLRVLHTSSLLKLPSNLVRSELRILIL